MCNKVVATTVAVSCACMDYELQRLHIIKYMYTVLYSGEIFAGPSFCENPVSPPEEISVFQFLCLLRAIEHTLLSSPG